MTFLGVGGGRKKRNQWMKYAGNRRTPPLRRRRRWEERWIMEDNWRSRRCVGFSFPFSPPPLRAFLKIIVWENGSGIKGGAGGIFFCPVDRRGFMGNVKTMMAREWKRGGGKNRTLIGIRQKATRLGRWHFRGSSSSFKRVAWRRPFPTYFKRGLSDGGE